MDKVECNSPIANRMSSAQLRKIKKPIIEKRRRERINDSLNQLKALVLDAMQKDESRYSKMEKADILEMTVHHLKNLHSRQNMMTSCDDQNLTQKYTAGFTECAKEVAQFMNTADGLYPDVRTRVMSHLSKCLQTVPRPQQQQQQQMQQPITPTPIIVSPVYREPVSPQAGHLASTPCATTIAALPGSPAGTYSPNMPQSLSPISLVTSSPLPITIPSNVVFMSPGSANSSPAHSPSGINNAIPLYTNGQRFSPESCSPPPSHQYLSQRSGRTPSTSPGIAEDVPSRFSAEEGQRLRETVIAKNNINAQISSCKSQARMAYHHDNMPASMWRPW